jgi:hypothetical protein
VGAPKQAEVPWSELRFDLFLLVAGTLLPLVFYLIDRHFGCCDWFPRSGALTAFTGAWLAYRSLGKHYVKFFKNSERGEALLTSGNQRLVDRLTFALSAAGTGIWAYGDKLFAQSCA